MDNSNQKTTGITTKIILKTVFTQITPDNNKRRMSSVKREYNITSTWNIQYEMNWNDSIDVNGKKSIGYRTLCGKMD